MSMSTGLRDDQVAFVDASYGKTGVKILYVDRDSQRHAITEYEVSILLKLNTRDDYVTGQNSAVIATDTQKNTVYAVAQRYGVGCPEEFALILCKHFLHTYEHVISAQVKVQTVNGWKRLTVDGGEHNHAFLSSPQAERYAEVLQLRGEAPKVTAGLSGLRLLKSTQSAFNNFHRCVYTTLNDTDDRILSTIVRAEWKYGGSVSTLDYNRAWSCVVDCILSQIAGPPGTGVFSPSVQQTMYDTQRLALARVPQMTEISMALPNVHYFDVDMTRFKGSGLKNTKNVYLPIDKPSGHIKATLRRKPSSKL